MNQEKSGFLSGKTILLLQPLKPDATGKWGVMNGQQMVEHLTNFFKISTQKIQYPVLTPEEQLPKFRAFLWSDKEFGENTKAPSQILPDKPLPLRNKTMQGAIDALDAEIKNFFHFFPTHPGIKVSHPVFGDLCFEEWVQLHHKHVIHHFKQFGLIN